MKKLDTASFHKSVTIYILFSMLILASATALSTLFFQKYIQKQKEREYNQQIHSSIEHVIRHYLHDYTYILRRIIQTTDLPALLKQKDRDGMYAFLKPKWDSLTEQEPCLTIMHIHSSDGTSFLRMHKPEVFDDRLESLRPMIKEIHSSHKPLDGYETGKYSNVYRIIYPVFDEEKNYLGAVELGLNPNFIIKVVHDINNFDGLLFIEDESLKLHSSPSDIVIDGYRLQSKLTPKLRPLAMKLNKNGQIEDHARISVREKKYLTHIYALNDFHDKPKVKIVFFQDIFAESSANNYYLAGIFLCIALVLLLLIWLIHRRIGLYHYDVSQIYKEQIEELNNSKRYLKAIFDVNPSIMITTNGIEIDRANPAMLEFFGYDTIESFKLEHDCICDYFLEEQGYLQAVMDDESWLEYMFKREGKIHIVSMLKNDKKHHFLVWAKKLEFDENNRAVAMLTDITEIKNLEKELRDKEELMIAQSRHAAMGEMISMIAHQWRQPITTIAMDANNILADIELESLDENSLRDTSKNIIHQTQELSKTIDDFRNFFKQDKAKEEVLVTDVFMESYVIINKSLQNNGVETENIFNSATKISIYSRELLQVFINLLKNAKEALVENRQQERKITNKIYETETNIIIEICDNAGGIGDKVSAKLFQPYFTTKDEKNGTGLGLYMSKTIVEKHLGGKISFTNINDEHGARVGACFKIQLPKKGLEND